MLYSKRIRGVNLKLTAVILLINLAYLKNIMPAKHLI